MAHNPNRKDMPRSIMQEGYEARMRVDDRLGLHNDAPMTSAMPGAPVPERDWEARAQLGCMENNHHGYGNYRRDTMFHGEEVDESLTSRANHCVEGYFNKGE